MAIYENITEFNGLPVVEYDYKDGISTAAGKAVKLMIGWDVYDEGFEDEEFVDGESMFLQLWKRFMQDDVRKEVTSLVIGDWGGAAQGDDSAKVVSALVSDAAKLPRLRALFIGEMTMEESEISWIEQSDVSGIWKAYPDLTHFQIRGGNGLSLGKIDHPNLTSLIVEAGALDAKVVKQVAEANLPNLKHLELWLGTEEYGANTSPRDLDPILSGRAFPKLEYLGLRNCDYVDEIAASLADAPILDRITSLDLSLGTLTDKGAEALLKSVRVPLLSRVDLHYHYLSDDMMARLRAAIPGVDVSEQQEDEDDDYRYVAHGE